MAGPKDPKRGLFGDVEDADIDLALDHWDEWDLEGKPSSRPPAPAAPVTPTREVPRGPKSGQSPAQSASTRVAPDPLPPGARRDGDAASIADDDFGLSGPAHALGDLLGTNPAARVPGPPSKVDDDLLGGGSSGDFEDVLSKLDLDSPAIAPVPQPRRLAATIRREDLAERRAKGAAQTVAAPAPTKAEVTSPTPIPVLARAASEPVDESFYDAIQVADGKDDTPGEEPAAVRRLTRNVVRRASGQAPALKSAPPEAPSAGPETLEVRVDPLDYPTAVRDDGEDEAPTTGHITHEVVIGDASSIELLGEEDDPETALARAIGRSEASDGFDTLINDDAPPPVTPRRSVQPRARSAWRDAVPEEVAISDSARHELRTPDPDDGSFEVRASTMTLPEQSDPLDEGWFGELGELFAREAEVTREGPRVATVKFGAARAAMGTGANDRARELLEEARAADPMAVAARRGLRRIYAAEKRTRDMAAVLDEEARATDGPGKRALLSLRADLLVAAGEDDLARVAVGELLDVAPDDAGALLASVALAFGDDRMSELAAAADKAARAVSDPDLAGGLRRVRVLAFERLGEDARPALAEALGAHPDDPPLRLSAARAAHAGHDPLGAERHLGQLAAGEVPAVLAAAARRLGAILADAGDPSGAAEALDRAAAAQPDEALVLEAHAASCERVGRLGDAARALEAWAACEPATARRAEVLRRAAGVHKQLGDAPAAAWALRRAWQSDPGDALLGAELGQAYVAAGDVDSAVALERAKLDAPGVEAGAALAMRLQASAMLERAERLSDALALLDWPPTPSIAAPRLSAIVLDRTARLLERLGKHGDVLDLYGAASEPDGDYRDVALRRMRGACAAQRMAWRVLAVGVREAGLGELPASADEALAARREAVERALTAWQRVLDVEPGAPTAHQASVALVLELGDPEAARIALEDARRAARRPAQAADYLVLAHVVGGAAAVGSTEPSLAEGIEELLARDPGEPRVAALAIERAAKHARWEEVVRIWLERMDRLPPGPQHDALAYRAAIALHERLGDDPRAVDVLGPVSVTRPTFGGAHNVLEAAYRRLGDAAALAAMVPPMTADGGEDKDLQFARLVRLGELLEERVKDHSRALGLYQRALAIRPEDPEAREGFVRTAAASRELHQLSDRAVGRLRAAQDRGDLAATVEAYEDLAWIDGELRGEQPMAKATWASIAALVPGHQLAQRRLERDAAAEGRLADVAGVWEAVEATLVVDERAPWTAARAALLEGAKHPDRATVASRAALSHVGEGTPPLALRLPLVRLDAALRGEGEGGRAELARVQAAAAALQSGDPRTAAAFLTRAGQLHEELGDADQALAAYRRAADDAPGHVPALEGWRRTALAAERWAEACEACERGHAAAVTDDERVTLAHLAGVIAMDRGLPVERAIQAFRKVISVRPRHDDAYARLRKLLEAADRPEELAELLSARLETELDKRRSLELHRTLAALWRDRLGDHDRAKAHLRAVLAQGGPDLATVASLSDIAWQKEQWAEAAELLILRARLEQAPEDVKRTFLRLGTIYSDKLPDQRWALKSFERVLAIEPDEPDALAAVARLAEKAGDLAASVTASERLVGLERRPVERIKLLHHLARVYEQGLKDSHRAEDALRRALDADPGSSLALSELATFYQRRNDTRSLRVQLDRVVGAMRMRIAAAPDGAAFGVIARALAMRAKLGVGGSLEAARCAAEVAVALGGAPDEDLALLNETLRGGSSARGLGDDKIDDALLHPALPGGARQAFALLGEVLAKRFPPDLRRWGVGRGDKLSKGPVRELVDAVAEELGVRDVDVYVSKTQPRALGVEGTDTVSVIIGADVLGDAKPAQVWFAVGRAVKIGKMGLAIPARLGGADLGLFLAGLVRQFDPGFMPPGLTHAAIGEEQQRLARLIPKKLLAELQAYAAVFTGGRFDPEAWFGALVHTANRAGLVASGGALGGLTVLARAGGHADLRAALRDPQVSELLKFAVSEEHCELRRLLAGK